MCESWNNCLAWSLGDKVLERKVMLEQSMAIMELKEAVINHETSPATTHWARFGDCRNQLVAKYIGNVVGGQQPKKDIMQANSAMLVG